MRPRPAAGRPSPAEAAAHLAGKQLARGPPHARGLQRPEGVHAAPGAAPAWRPRACAQTWYVFHTWCVFQTRLLFGFVDDSIRFEATPRRLHDHVIVQLIKSVASLYETCETKGRPERAPQEFNRVGKAAAIFKSRGGTGATLTSAPRPSPSNSTHPHAARFGSSHSVAEQRSKSAENAKRYFFVVTINQS